MNQQKILRFIFFLCMLGILLSGYLTYIHYSNKSSPCDLNETFQCNLVNKSKYAEILGIPVAIFGVAGYLLLGLITAQLFLQTKVLQTKVDRIRNRNFICKYIVSKTLLIVSLPALLFSFYLTYVEFFIITAICIVCVLSQLTIISIFGMSYKNYKIERIKRGVVKE